MNSNRPAGARHFLLPLFCATLVLTSNILRADTLKIMKNELDRSFIALQDEETPPYYISYEITENVGVTVEGAFGEVTNQTSYMTRNLDLDVRVGSYEMDNTHPYEGFPIAMSMAGLLLPVLVAVDDEESLRTALWLKTDSQYKAALQLFKTIQEETQSEQRTGTQVEDFSKAPVSEYSEEKIEPDWNVQDWTSHISRYSTPFAEAETIHYNRVEITCNVETRWFVNTEGSKIQTSKPLCRMKIVASTRADDGVEFSLSRMFSAESVDRLVNETEVLASVNKMITDLEALRQAPALIAYEGPAILGGRASSVFFHQIVGQGLEGNRLLNIWGEPSIRLEIGERVLPESFTVIFDPTVVSIRGERLLGHYTFDNEGVRGKRVMAIEGGIPVEHVRSRTPVNQADLSNGHGRREAGNRVSARQSSMFVEVSDFRTPEELEALLLARVREQGKSYGLYIEELTDLETQANDLLSMSLDDVFQIGPTVKPLSMYKIYLDGTKELLRGTHNLDVNLDLLRQVETGSSDFHVFNVMSTGESGSVPVSTVAPSIFLSQIEFGDDNGSESKPNQMPGENSIPNSENAR